MLKQIISSRRDLDFNFYICWQVQNIEMSFIMVRQECEECIKTNIILKLVSLVDVSDQLRVWLQEPFCVNLDRIYAFEFVEADWVLGTILQTYYAVTDGAIILSNG